MSGLSNALERLHQVLARIDAGRDLDEVLQAVTDGIVDISGFTLAVASVPRGRRELEVVAVTESGEGVSSLLGERFPRARMERQWEIGQSRGQFVFVPADLAEEIDLRDGPGQFIPDFEPLDRPDAWLPLDWMNAPLRNPDGELLGCLAVDLPRDGLRPSDDVVEVMNVFAMQATLAIGQAMQREQLREELWLRGMVNELFAVTGEKPLEESFEQALTTVRSEMAASDMWVEVFASDPRSRAGRRSWGGHSVPTVRAALAAIGPRLVEQVQQMKKPLAVHVDPSVGGHPHAAAQALQRALAADGASRVLVAPLPRGREVVGQVALFRTDDRTWSQAEREVILDVGRALGWAVERERALAEVDAARADVDRERDERARMLSSLARQVRGAMSVVDDHLRAEDLPEDHPARQAMVEFWILFGRVTRMSGYQTHPERVRRSPVDIAQVLTGMWDRLTARAAALDVTLLPLDRAGGGVPVASTDRDQLEWLLFVLCEDVLADTVEGGSVRVVVVRRGERVLVSCQASGVEEPLEPAHAVPGPPSTWWFTGAQALVSRLDGRLSVKEGPMDRRVVTLELPAASTRDSSGFRVG